MTHEYCFVLLVNNKNKTKKNKMKWKRFPTFRSCRWRRSTQRYYSAIWGRACGSSWYIVILIFTRLLADTTRGGYALYNERAAMSNRVKSKLEMPNQRISVVGQCAEPSANTNRNNINLE